MKSRIRVVGVFVRRLADTRHYFQQFYPPPTRHSLGGTNWQEHARIDALATARRDATRRFTSSGFFYHLLPRFVYPFRFP